MNRYKDAIELHQLLRSHSNSIEILRHFGESLVNSIENSEAYFNADTDAKKHRAASTFFWEPVNFAQYVEKSGLRQSETIVALYEFDKDLARYLIDHADPTDKTGYVPYGNLCRSIRFLIEAISGLLDDSYFQSKDHARYQVQLTQLDAVVTTRAIVHFMDFVRDTVDQRTITNFIRKDSSPRYVQLVFNPPFGEAEMDLETAGELLQLVSELVGQVERAVGLKETCIVEYQIVRASPLELSLLIQESLYEAVKYLLTTGIVVLLSKSIRQFVSTKKTKKRSLSNSDIEKMLAGDPAVQATFNEMLSTLRTRFLSVGFSVTFETMDKFGKSIVKLVARRVDAITQNWEANQTKKLGAKEQKLLPENSEKSDRE